MPSSIHIKVPFAFAGDKRSFSMMSAVATRLASEKRKGWAVANVVAEMCEAFVSLSQWNAFRILQRVRRRAW